MRRGRPAGAAEPANHTVSELAQIGVESISPEGERHRCPERLPDRLSNAEIEDQPDFEAEYHRYDWLIGEAEPRDALLHHPLTVHGATGNRTSAFRRAVSSTYVGDRVSWNPHPSNMFRNKDLTGHVRLPQLAPGGSIECELFPRVWPVGGDGDASVVYDRAASINRSQVAGARGDLGEDVPKAARAESSVS